MNQKSAVPQKAVIERWTVGATVLALTYANATAKANGWGRESGSDWSKYLYQLQNSLSKAVISGELRACERFTGLYLEPGLEAYNDGGIDLQDFCNWACGAGLIGVPDDALKLAAALGLPHEADLSVPQQAHLLNAQDTTPSPAPEPPAAPVVAAEAATVRETRQAIDAPKFSMSKAALIAAHEHEWPTIKRDIADASQNGLAAAKAGPREWWEAQAMEWARSKGKRGSASKPATVLAQTMHSMASIPGRRHKLEG